MSDSERDRIGRLVTDTVIYPGYPWLVIGPTHRSPMQTIRGNRYEELEVTWPKRRSWDCKKFAVRPNGTVIGFADPNGIISFAPGMAEFQRVDLPEHVAARYEPHRDILLLYQEDGALLEWNGDMVVPSPLSGTGRGMHALPRYIPELNVWLAGLRDRLLVRGDGPLAKWRTLPIWQLGGRMAISA